MYSWNYIVTSALDKLDLTTTEESTRFTNRFRTYANEVMTQICSSIKPKRTFVEFEVDELGEEFIMPNDFVSFGDGVCTIKHEVDGRLVVEEAYDTDFLYKGYNKIVGLTEGVLSISYNARWLDFSKITDENAVLDVPADVLDCIASYIASQCYKVDDDYKAAVYRNEYELALSRINDSDYDNTRTFKIEGDW